MVFYLSHISHTYKHHNSAHSRLAVSCQRYWIPALFTVKSLKYRLSNASILVKRARISIPARWDSLQVVNVLQTLRPEVAPVLPYPFLSEEAWTCRKASPSLLTPLSAEWLACACAQRQMTSCVFKNRAKGPFFPPLFSLCPPLPLTGGHAPRRLQLLLSSSCLIHLPSV